MRQNVYLVGCDNYNEKTINNSLNNLFSLMGSIDEIVKPNDTVFLKLNLLSKKSPDEATTTHPALVESVVKLIQKAGGKVIIGDSPGGPYTEKALRAIYSATGIDKVAENTGCELNYDVTSKTVKVNGNVSKSLDIITPVINCDKIIAVGKLKTHSLMTATMSVKLCYGYIPGLIKADYHFRMPHSDDFAELLVDIYEFRKPDLNIIDAVYGMEGNGPSAGEPIKVGCLIAGTNGHALDTAAAHLMKMSPLSIPTIKCAKKRNLFSGNINDIEIIGDKVEHFATKFKHPKLRSIDNFTSRLPRFAYNFLSKKLQPRPLFLSDKCKGCRDCENACPANAIQIIDNKAVVNLEKCIHCFCCHELCLHEAVEIKKPFINKLLTKSFHKCF